MGEHSHRKAAKKRFLWRRKARDLLMFRHQQAREREQERVEGLEEERAPKRKPGSTIENAEIWSAKTQEIRDKLTGKKRMAEDRWNRFAGTGDAGGKGL